MSSEFIVPSLADGKLSQADALSVYINHLNTPRKDYRDLITLPCRESIFNSMFKIHKNHNIVIDDDNISKIVTEYIENGKNVYFWSDLHFFHKNIISHANRPFDSMEIMHDELIKNYIDTVNDDDLVIFGGDISFSGVENTKPLLDTLPGKKIWVLGNHDFKSGGRLINFNFTDLITMCFVFYVKKDDGSIMNYIVSHYPIDNKWLPENTLNIHGHTHQYTMDKKNINMSVEAINYRPTKLV